MPNRIVTRGYGDSHLLVTRGYGQALAVVLGAILKIVAQARQVLRVENC